MKTPYGIEFEVVSEINDSWCDYDKLIARNQLHSYGVIFINPEYKDPIDNFFDLEEITNYYLSTLEISREQIREGLEKRSINIVNNENGYIIAQIGDYWFYFLNADNELLPAEEYLSSHDMTDVVEAIYQSINDEPIKGSTWNDSTEWLYYRAVLLEKKE